MAKKDEFELILIPKDELEFRAWEIAFGSKDIIDIITNKDVLVKFLNKISHWYASKLWLGKFKGNEAKAYISMEVISEITDELEKIEQKYNVVMQERLKAAADKENKDK